MTKGAHPDDLDKMAAAQLDFERNFGCGDNVHAYLSELGGENVIVVENHTRRAFYSFSIELLKVFNLTGTDE